MDWTKSKIFILIDLYHNHPCLWYPKHVDYRNRKEKSDAFNEISDTMDCDVHEVKRKVESLLASFRRERQKYDLHVTSNANGVYKSKWFGFDKMAFLLDKSLLNQVDIQDSYQYNEEQEEFIVLEANAGDFPNRTQSPAPIAEEKCSLIPLETSKEILLSSGSKIDPIAETNLDNDYMDSNASFEYNVRMESPLQTITKKECVNDDPMEVNSVYKSIKVAEDKLRLNNMNENLKLKRKDISDTWGEYIASKHRNYNVHVRSIVEHKIAEIIFSAEMRGYEAR